MRNGKLTTSSDALSRLGVRLKMLTVFRGLLENKLVKSFIAYTDAGTVGEKSLHFSAMVRELYDADLTMSEYVTRAVFEDENPYVKAKAKGRAVREELAIATERELTMLSDRKSVV